VNPKPKRLIDPTTLINVQTDLPEWCRGAFDGCEALN